MHFLSDLGGYCGLILTVTILGDYAQDRIRRRLAWRKYRRLAKRR